jgi:hypothetical protein
MTRVRLVVSYARQQFAMIVKEMIRAHLTLVHIFHAMSQWASVGGTYIILVYMIADMVG